MVFVVIMGGQYLSRDLAIGQCLPQESVLQKSLVKQIKRNISKFYRQKFYVVYPKNFKIILISLQAKSRHFS